MGSCLSWQIVLSMGADAALQTIPNYPSIVSYIHSDIIV
jgi:hypothetical protein